MKKIIALFTALLLATICLPIQTVSAQSNRVNVHKISKHWKKCSDPIKFPILMYHSIAATGNSLNVPIEQFEEEISYLKSHHYYFLTPHEAYTVLKTNKKPQKNIVWVTLDDGYKNNFDALKNLYKNYHAKATVFDIINGQNAQSFLSHYQLKHLKNSHIAIQNHTFHHVDLDRLTKQKQSEEMITGKDNLDTLLHQKTIAVAYPAGHYNQFTPQLAEKSGHKLAVTTNEGLAHKDNGLLSLSRVRVNKGISIKEFGQIIING
ncbi:polysaccharide deacetylase family protein [Companilactobacillus jidongensis]|uniref:polysaccharide deacetylase family protein n=1 Tax=Companilactobacillus jidongensis TaxID=2486006 RepID=UPI000F78D896|nr:polysaccharide deacetylase family protein [Companilactobacillus jidongensis]